MNSETTGLKRGIGARDMFKLESWGLNKLLDEEEKSELKSEHLGE